MILRQGATGVDWRFGGSVEVSRNIQDNLDASVSYGILTRRPDLVPPDSLPEGPVNSELLEPALVLYDLETLTQSASVTVAWRPPRRVGLWTRATFASVGVDPDERPSPLFERRSALSIDVGVTLPD